MKKVVLLLVVLSLAGCTSQKTEKPVYNHPNLSGEIPATATGVEWYQYPAIPLEEYNKIQNQSGTHN